MKKTIILSETDLKNIIKKVLNKKTYIFEQSSEGCIKGDCQNGEGTFVDGDRKYVGTFKNGNREGKGILYYNNVKYYEGDWKNDMWGGKGKFYDTNTKNLNYEGNFVDYKLTGYGKEYDTKTGKLIYYGNFDDYNWQGKGTYINKYNVKLTGNWVKNKLNGRDTKQLDKLKTNIDFINNNLNPAVGCIEGDCSDGKGTYVSENENKYTGNFIDSMENGYGTTTYWDGTKHSGQYKNGKMNGQGSYININKVKLTGNWVNGTLNGKRTDELDKIRKLDYITNNLVKNKNISKCKEYLNKKRQNEKFSYYSKKEEIKKFKEEHIGSQFVEDSPYKCEADGKTYYFVKVKVQKNVDDNTDDKNTNTEKENTYNKNVDTTTCTQPTDIKYQYPNDKYWRYAISPEGCWWAKKDRPGTPNDGKWFNLSALAKDNPTKYNTPINNLNTAFTNKTLIDVTNNNNNDDDGGGGTTEIEI